MSYPNQQTTWRGHLLIADFHIDIAQSALKGFVREVDRKLEALETRRAVERFDKIEIGIYDGDVRVWPVWSV